LGDGLVYWRLPVPREQFVPAGDRPIGSDLPNDIGDVGLRLKAVHLCGLDDRVDRGGDNWAVIATLIENCKISGINPHTWLTETLGKLAEGHPANAVGELMPWTAVG